VGDPHERLAIKCHRRLSLSTDDVRRYPLRRGGLYIRAVHVLVAPDKFRGTLTAAQAARAIETGWRRSRPDDTIELVPMADGGEGTLDALVEGLGGTTHEVRVAGPLMDIVRAPYGIVATARGTIAIVEMARASGLALLAEGRRNPRKTTTRGTGELIRMALDHHPSQVIVCIGGSATNDGGVGAAQSLLGRFLDAAGDHVGPGGTALLDLDRIDLRPLVELVGNDVSFVVASDVDNPLCGPAGASVVYGPQKGATPDDVRLLDRALGHLAAVVHRDLGIDLKDAPGAGAAGGLGFGMMAFLGAHLRPGVEVVMDAVGLRGRLERAGLVIAGEGKLDAQSMHGKTIAGVLRAAEEASVPGAIVCGVAEVWPPGITVRSLVERFGEDAALNETRRSLETLAEELAADAEAITR
jgi:glycerate kinase